MRLLLGIALIWSFFNTQTLMSQTLLKEDFDSLKSWEPLTFEKIKEHSTYEVKNSMLIAKSKNSASGITFEKNYDIYKYPVLNFKWKITNIFEKGDATTKEGDDYPIRIYVMFKYDPKKASFFEAIKYDIAKSIYGEYPPHSTINYIWSNKMQKEKIITSSYTDMSKMIILNSGKTKINTWQEHSVNVLEDYKKAFGQNPPSSSVTLAIMSDSDNTGGSSTSYIDYIEVKQKFDNEK